VNLQDVLRLVARLVPEGVECVFCHCSVKGLGIALTEAARLLDTLRITLGPRCTLAVPSFPYATSSEYRQYVTSAIQYDVRRTPARVNLVGELFRRSPNTHRSLDPVYPIAAAGPLADELTHDNVLDAMPFGSRTGLGRIAARRTCVLGLGVTLNTNSFAHLLDEPFLAQLPVRIYPDRPVSATILRDGITVATGEYYYITPDVRRTIRPERILDKIAGRAFFRTVDGAPPCYGLDLQEFVEFGTRLARESLAAGQLPVWHQRT
jgi:aminoglycoside N3'-acetyltransferase